MFERVMFDLLESTLRMLAGSPRAMQAFVDSIHGLDIAKGEPDRLKEIIQAFAAQEKPVIFGYARDDTVFPVWSIVLAADEEDLRGFGDETSDDDEDGNPVKASVWMSTYQILTYSKHPDVCLYLYKLLRAIVIQNRTELIRRAGMINATKLSGAELMPDRIYLPAFLFVRALTISGQEQQEGLTLLGPDQPLLEGPETGLHVLDPGRPDTLPRGITTYTSEE